MKRTDAVGNDHGKFVAGDPTTGRIPTRLDPSWLNTIQEEIISVIQKANRNPEDKAILNPDSTAQLGEAVEMMGILGKRFKPVVLKNGTMLKAPKPKDKYIFERTDTDLWVPGYIQCLKFWVFVTRKFNENVFTHLDEITATRNSFSDKWSISTESNTHFSAAEFDFELTGPNNSTQGFIYGLSDRGALSYACGPISKTYWSKLIGEEVKSYDATLQVGHLRVM